MSTSTEALRWRVAKKMAKIQLSLYECDTTCFEVAPDASIRERVEKDQAQQCFLRIADEVIRMVKASRKKK